MSRVFLDEFSHNQRYTYHMDEKKHVKLWLEQESYAWISGDKDIMDSLGVTVPKR